jgi:hypothetical protein
MNKWAIDRFINEQTIENNLEIIQICFWMKIIAEEQWIKIECSMNDQWMNKL